MAPTTFNRQGDRSAVYQQPHDPQQEIAALQALLSCPTASIGTVEKMTTLRDVQATFPLPVADSVFHCGYHAESSYGAASYFIQRPEGNVLVDSPRFAAPLVKQLEKLGGVRYLYLTHRDDVADHQRFHDHFGCDRLLHQGDITPDTAAIEIPLGGVDPIQFAEDMLILPVPGHSRGHTVLIYQNRFLFSGDHLAWSDPLQQLYAFRRYCWYSWEAQRRSMAKLAQYSFEWVLPGHGRRYHSDHLTMAQQMQFCLQWMEKVA
jgi:glyoxylase-like metal-dependent hydrolase (beta-lactamase superfamily II)